MSMFNVMDPFTPGMRFDHACNRSWATSRTTPTPEPVVRISDVVVERSS